MSILTTPPSGCVQAFPVLRFREPLQRARTDPSHYIRLHQFFLSKHSLLDCGRRRRAERRWNGDSPINTNCESHRFGVLEPSYLQHLMAFKQLLKVRSAKCVDQKAFDGRVSHRGFPACVDCREDLEVRPDKHTQLDFRVEAAGGSQRSPSPCRAAACLAVSLAVRPRRKRALRTLASHLAPEPASRKAERVPRY